jgi:N-dimethylarginine dimethylaminohydrolase
MCPPEHFTVSYEINPWMDSSAPVDTELAVKQWQTLRETLESLGHTVHVLEPQSGLPDMVFAANGAFTVDGVAYGAQYKYPQRAAEAKVHQAFYEGRDWTFVAPGETNEGEGDFAYAAGLILAGYGFRTDVKAHAEAQEVLGRPVISLRLTDPRFYHLDTALAAIDDDNIAYYPAAFSDSSQRVLRQLFPGAIIAGEEDAVAFALNLVSDNYHVFLNAESQSMADKVVAQGYLPVMTDLSELKKGGGSVKCCIAELRR